MKSSISAFTVLLLVLSQSVEADRIYVNSGAGGGNDGSSWTDAYTSLQTALAAANAGDELWVAGGPYELTSSGATFTLKSVVPVYCGFAGGETTLGGRDPGGRTVLSGDEVAETVVTAIASVHPQNSFYIDQAIITKGRNSNTTKAAGLHSVGTINVVRCDFVDNIGGKYGALHIKTTYSEEWGSVEWSTFSSNHADAQGEAFTSFGGGLTFDGIGEINHSQFHSNFATNGHGGGMAVIGSDTELIARNCLFAGTHKASCTGCGAIYVGGGAEAEIRNCTVHGSQVIKFGTECAVTPQGGGLFAEGSGTSVTVDSSIFWDNEYLEEGEDNVTSEIVAAGAATVTVTYTDVEGGYSGTGNINQNPLFVGDARISDVSPCRDAGNPAFNLAWDRDLDDLWREVGPEVDMGINEVQIGACCRGDDVCQEFDEGDCENYVCDVAALRNDSGGSYYSAGYAGCYADADANGAVNAADRGIITANIGATNYDLICLFDLDGNGTVNAGDRGFVSAEIGYCHSEPDFQNGSGNNNGSPDARFSASTWTLSSCNIVDCSE
jgi:hypothetical protein